VAESGLTAAARAEQVARASYGRLLAILAAPTGDIPAAEDALADAFVRAMTTWPRDGIPDNPEGWLITVARNRQRDVYKSAAYRTAAPLDDESHEWSPLDEFDPVAIPDKRLALLFVCAHPAIAPGIRTPLMLQTVLGFDAAQIAAIFAIPESTIAGRLVRAKRRIKDARIPFAVPEKGGMPSRLPAVLEAVYGCYAIEWQRVPGATGRGTLADEALYLAITLASLLAKEPEAFGLAALICLSMARANARDGDDFVPLDEQDVALWDASLIREGERYLRQAHALGRIGRFQLEAAIQSVHCDRAVSGTTDWVALRTLYEGLIRVAPTLGALVSHAATIAETDGPAAGLNRLNALDNPGIPRFQPAWATRAHLLAELGKMDDARTAFAKAISLTTDPRLRVYLQRRSDSLT
jgi:RNA polymerase sigma-70 factor (ECF subfamily)